MPSPIKADPSSLDMILTREEYNQVKREFEQQEYNQSKFVYRSRKFLSENLFTKYICCCLKVKDSVNVSWDDMTP